MSIEIHRETKRARAIERNARDFRALTLAPLTERLAAVGAPPGDAPETELDAGQEPVNVPDFDHLQRFCVQAIAHARQQLLGVQAFYRRELHDDGENRRLRDEALAAAYERAVAVRKVMEGALGVDKALEVLGFDGPTPQEPALLIQRMEEAVGRLSDPGLVAQLDGLKVAGMSQDWGALADWLEEARARLEERLEIAASESSERAAAIVAREAARTRFNDFVVGFSRILDGIYVVAGQRELVSRLRPTLRTGSGPGGELPPAPPAPPDGEPPGPPPVDLPPDEPPAGSEDEAPPFEPPAEQVAA